METRGLGSGLPSCIVYDMTNSRRTNRWLFDVWTVECHTCAADPGEPCTTLRGRARELPRMNSHAARWDLARRTYLGG